MRTTRRRLVHAVRLPPAEPRRWPQNAGVGWLERPGPCSNEAVIGQRFDQRMFSRTGAGIVGLTLLFGCGKAATQSAEPAPEDTSTAPAPGESGKDDAAAVSADVSASGGASSTPAEDPIVLAGRLCGLLCEEIKGACTERQAQFCQASCPDWLEAAKQCPIEVEEALTCQTSADRFLLCSNVATANCAPLYRTLSDCREGKRPPKTEKGPPPAAGVPAGYVRHALPSLGGFFLLPEGPLDEKSESKVVANRPPRTYLIERMTGVPSKPLTDMTVLQIASAYVGNPCVAKLRLYARFEKGDLTYIRFTTTCKDGAPWAGIFHLQPGNGVATSVRVPAGQALPEDVDTYLYGFEPTNAPPARNNDVEP